MNNKKTTEQDWLNSVKQVFDYAAQQRPPMISQSEVESLLIGLRGLEKIPLTGKPLSPAGQKTVEMLQGYLDIMKQKKKKFLPIKK